MRLSFMIGISSVSSWLGGENPRAGADIPAYSYRRASIGSSAAAFLAG